MAREFFRTDRLSAQIQRELAQMIRDEMRDPRVVGVTVAEVRVARDLGHARVFVSTFSQELDLGDAVRVLDHAAPRLRGILGRRLHIRAVPKLEFIADRVAEHGSRISALINDAIDADQQGTSETGEIEPHG
ncbi:MAG TPA: 30S ribosome-binding factor RbfA [Chromatiaceae bacterium]|jgi:ribosome-binding factor A|nr:30S ribosome-binding factor RbfA [Chromatiaceae bacterium]HIN81628.1 30S ribosome-binding factor RbfA [Chromatiales bacterium]HIA08328.1 30S ribosome-binding factor RbfA [Chromatiaceae bacterium]HIB85371.1 30S ribosome-binding factor RbfA [Chromatiaceae bacterium]HIO14509.1 30S ribosome-binding factor RbfA [Chromatiales bacterium]